MNTKKYTLVTRGADFVDSAMVNAFCAEENNSDIFSDF